MSDQTPDSPPRPQYGEYATPEEQRARIRQPAPEAATRPGSVQGTAATAAAHPVSTKARPTQPPLDLSTPQSRVRVVDRIVTFALLTYGLVNVVAVIPALLDYSAYADTVFELLKVDATLADPAAGRPWGYAAAIVLAAGWLITAALSWWSIRRGRLTWWIPLLGGIVFTFAAGTLMLVPIMSDPAAWNALLDSVR
jgi:hypothetical protein